MRVSGLVSVSFAFRFVFVAICMGFKRFLVFFVGASSVSVVIYMGFKESHFKNS